MTRGKYFSVEADGDRLTLKGFNSEYNKQQRVAYALPEKISAIGKTAFGWSKALSFELPDGLKEIGCNAFYGCKNLKFVFIPQSVVTIADGAFEGCYELTIYCEDEPVAGWVEEQPRYETQEIYTDADYAFDFHRGGVNMSRCDVDVSANWNKSKLPVKTHVTREEFKKLVQEYIQNS